MSKPIEELIAEGTKIDNLIGRLKDRQSEIKDAIRRRAEEIEDGEDNLEMIDVEGNRTKVIFPDDSVWVGADNERMEELEEDVLGDSFEDAFSKEINVDFDLSGELEDITSPDEVDEKLNYLSENKRKAVKAALTHRSNTPRVRFPDVEPDSIDVEIEQPEDE